MIFLKNLLKGKRQWSLIPNLQSKESHLETTWTQNTKHYLKINELTMNLLHIIKT
jgi:hypothetical protein